MPPEGVPCQQISYWSHNCDKAMPDGRDLRERSLLWSMVQRRCSLWRGRPGNRPGRQPVTSPLQSGSRERQTPGLSLLSVRLSPLQEGALPTFKVDHPCSGEHHWKHLHGHAQRCDAVVIVNPPKVTVKITTHSRESGGPWGVGLIGSKSGTVTPMLPWRGAVSLKFLNPWNLETCSSFRNGSPQMSLVKVR